MSRIHEDLEYKDFEQPTGIQPALVCKVSGQLAQDHLCEYDQRGSMVFSEFFAQDNMPVSVCDTHISVNICTESGMVAGPFCPEDEVKSVVYVRSAVDKLTGQEDSGATNDASYVITDEELNTFCTLHDENYQDPSEMPDEENPTDGENESGEGNESVNGGGSSDDGEEPDDSPDEDDSDDDWDEEEPE
jgi:penicillin-binding protein 1A